MDIHKGGSNKLWAELEEHREEEEERLSSLIQKCPNIRILHQIHSYILTHPLPVSTLSFSLSKILAFCSLSPHCNLPYAEKVFSQIPNPNIFSYNSLIRAYSQSKTPSNQPFQIFKNLIKKVYPKPNSFTISFVLKACSILPDFREGFQVHSKVIRTGFSSSSFVQTALVNFYAKCEEIEFSQKVFDEMPERNLIAWSVMISGYTKIGMFGEGLGLFREMQKMGFVPDQVTLVSVISACAGLGALDIGRWVHAYIDRKIIVNDVELSTALINMYAKCGCIERAKQVFDAMPLKDAKAWSSMIVGFAIHGQAEDAFDVFYAMEEAKVEPNPVAFTGILSACAHGGLVTEGKRYWSMMVASGIEPSMEQYGCFVDLLCRANLISEAYKFVKTMPINPDPVIFRTLLVGCKKNKILNTGEMVATRLLELEPFKAENYVLLSSLYAACSDWGQMCQVRQQMKDKCIKAIRGCSSIEVDGIVHEFVLGDWSHPESNEIREVLREISERVCETGHDPRISSVLRMVGGKEKEEALCEHSERLAIAFAILKTRTTMVIRVFKNLRVCNDCHEVTKIISKLYNREIIVRDRLRFHKFVNGACSCRDFW